MALPEQFGPYRILRLLGKGGMGEVYLAHDPRHDRQVALKVPTFGPDDDPKIRARFQREILAASRVQHPNICPVYDAGEIDGRCYLTMAYVEGPSLQQIVRKGPLPPPAEAAAIVCKVALALHEAHRGGLLHRDVKSSNIMMTTAGEPILMDFGLARHLTDVRLTVSGAVVGSPHYLAPEQASGEAVPASDVYGLGVVLYELLTGRVPFKGDTLMQVLAQLLMETPEPPSRHRPEVIAALDAVCLKAIAKDLAQRYASMAEFASALLPFLPANGATPDTLTLSQAPARPALAAAGRVGRAVPWVLVGSAAAAPGMLLLDAALGPWVLAWDAAALLAAGAWTLRAGARRGPGTAGPGEDTASRSTVVTPQARGPERELVNSLVMGFVWVPPGTFRMGSPADEARRAPDEGPQHEVEIARGFYLGRHPVTQGQYRTVMGVNPACFHAGNGGGAEHPVEKVSWEDAVEFCRRLSARAEEKKAGRTYRLPTEAEWEYACRAGTQTPFHGGASLGAAAANFAGDYPYGDAPRGPDLQCTAPVGSYPPNAWGLYDLHGNVWEWCSDWYDPGYYKTSPRRAPRGPSGGSLRVLRGGCWAVAAENCRSARRDKFAPGARSSFIGFRVVCICAS
jgi:formylglycine-generating enzyme required for sulfatase activity